MKPNEKYFIKSFGNKANSNSNKTEELIEKKLKEYYSNQTVEIPYNFENAIQTAFTSKHNKKFLSFTAHKQNLLEKFKNFRKTVQRQSMRILQSATVLICIFGITYFVHATSFLDYLMNVFNLSDINFDNKGIEDAIENGELQNINMDYIKQNGVGIKISYVLMNDLSLYIVFDIETDFSLYEKDVNNVTFGDINITNEKGNFIYQQDIKDNFKGYKAIVQDEHHMKNVFFIIAKEIPKCKELNIYANKIRFYKKGEKNLNLNEFNEEFNLEYNIKLDNSVNNKMDMSYNIVDKKIQNNNIKIRKAICDETGLNLLIEANDIDFKVIEKGILKKDEASIYYIENLEQGKKLFVVNMYEEKDKQKINIEIEYNGKTNEYEITKK